MILMEFSAEILWIGLYFNSLSIYILGLKNRVGKNDFDNVTLLPLFTLKL